MRDFSCQFTLHDKKGMCSCTWAFVLPLSSNHSSIHRYHLMCFGNTELPCQQNLWAVKIYLNPHLLTFHRPWLCNGQVSLYVKYSTIGRQSIDFIIESHLYLDFQWSFSHQCMRGIMNKMRLKFAPISDCMHANKIAQLLSVCYLGIHLMQQEKYLNQVA